MMGPVRLARRGRCRWGSLESSRLNTPVKSRPPEDDPCKAASNELACAAGLPFWLSDCVLVFPESCWTSELSASAACDPVAKRAIAPAAAPLASLELLPSQARSDGAGVGLPAVASSTASSGSAAACWSESPSPPGSAPVAADVGSAEIPWA